MFSQAKSAHASKECQIGQAAAVHDDFIPFELEYAKTFADYELIWELWFIRRNGVGHQFAKRTLELGIAGAEAYRELGFRLEGNDLIAPTFEQAMKVFRNSHVRPGFAYVSRRNPRDVKYLPIWMAAPEGYVVVDSEKITPEMMGPMILANLYPISTERLRHDLNHLLGMRQFKNYHDVLKTLQIQFATGSALSSLDKHFRFGFFLEAYSFVPERNRDKLVTLIGAPFERDASPTVTTVRKFDEAKDLAKIREEATKLLAEYLSLLELYGGAARDWNRYWVENWIAEGLGSLAQRLSFALNDEAHVSHRDRKFDLRLEFARFRTALFYSVGITPDIFARAMRAIKHEPTDPVYRLLVFSQVGVEVMWNGQDGNLLNSLAHPTVDTMRGARIREGERMRVTYGISATMFAASTRDITQYEVTNRRLVSRQWRFETIMAHAILSLPLDRQNTMLGYAKGKYRKNEVIDFLTGKEYPDDTLDARNDRQREFFDLVEALMYIRQAGFQDMFGTTTRNLIREVQGWP